jgi:hypothetical protein
MVARWVEH